MNIILLRRISYLYIIKLTLTLTFLEIPWRFHSSIHWDKSNSVYWETPKEIRRHFWWHIGEKQETWHAIRRNDSWKDS